MRTPHARTTRGIPPVGERVRSQSAADGILGDEKCGAGQTAFVLFRERGWSYGAPANHSGRHAGDGDCESVNVTFR